MFKLFCIVAFLGAAYAVPAPYRPGAVAPVTHQGDNKYVATIRQTNDVNPDGSYQWSFQAENGITAEEQGAVKNLGQKDAEALEVRGSFEYTSPDGTPITVHYVANENGYQPEGAHLPVAPEVPAAIARALAYIAAHPQAEERVVAAVKPTGYQNRNRY